ncbi:MAG TPA: sigma-70 family RNA polymerase sigma factor [Thermoanaerobaculia bacterium]
MTTPSDEILLARIAQRDLDAFQTFHERFAARVIAYAERHASDRQLAEDISQEVFLSVWTKAATYRPDRGTAAGWLYTLTRNKIVDLWRRSGKGAEPEPLDDLLLPGPPEADGDLRLTVRQALAQLAPESRTALVTAYFGDLTYEETAGRLGLPVGTLKSRIRVGLRALRERLTATGV